MKNIKDHLLILGGLFLFLLDQTFKYFAYHNQSSVFVWKKLFGWEFYANKGIAFSLPFPDLIILLFTPIILFLIIAYFLKTKPKNKLVRFSFLLILLGSLSNYIDRIMFGITIDYLRVFTGVINLADVMIVVGVFILLLKSKNKGPRN